MKSMNMLCTAVFGAYLAACGGPSTADIPDAAMVDTATATDAAATDAAAPATCGGFAGLLCAANEFCDYGDNLCGTNDMIGTCKPRPTVCPLAASPVCGCDGAIHDNQCHAETAGTDVSAAADCTVPAEFFACGYRLCAEAREYCQREPSDVPTLADAYGCVDLPAACSNRLDCNCVTDEPCGNTCTLEAGHLVLTCPGG